MVDRKSNELVELVSSLLDAVRLVVGLRLGFSNTVQGLRAAKLRLIVEMTREVWGT